MSYWIQLSRRETLIIWSVTVAIIILFTSLAYFHYEWKMHMTFNFLNPGDNPDFRAFTVSFGLFITSLIVGAYVTKRRLPLFLAITLWVLLGLILYTFLSAIWGEGQWPGRLFSGWHRLENTSTLERVKTTLTAIGGIGGVGYLVIKYRERSAAERGEADENYYKQSNNSAKVQHKYALQVSTHWLTWPIPMAILTSSASLIFSAAICASIAPAKA